MPASMGPPVSYTQPRGWGGEESSNQPWEAGLGIGTGELAVSRGPELQRVWEDSRICSGHMGKGQVGRDIKAVAVFYTTVSTL